MTRKASIGMPNCVCGRPASEHDFSRKTPGHATVNCICYRVVNARRLSGAELEAEMCHWSHHVGNPPNTPQMLPVEIEAARLREVEFQRSTILQRTIEAAREMLDDVKWRQESAMCEIAEAEAELLNLMLQPEVITIVPRELEEIAA